MFENFPDVLTVKNLSEMLNIGRNSAYDLVKTNQIHSIKVKSQIRIPKESVINYLRGEAQPIPLLRSYESYQANARIYVT